MKILMGFAALFNVILAAGIGYLLVTAPMAKAQSVFDIGVNLFMLLAALSMLWGYRYGMSRKVWSFAVVTNAVLLIAFCATLGFLRAEIQSVGLPVLIIAFFWVSTNLYVLFQLAGQSTSLEAKSDDIKF